MIHAADYFYSQRRFWAECSCGWISPRAAIESTAHTDFVFHVRDERELEPTPRTEQNKRLRVLSKADALIRRCTCGVWRDNPHPDLCVRCLQNDYARTEVAS